MKTKLQVLVVFILILTLAACSQQPSAGQSQVNTQQASGMTTLSLSKMLYGILALEDAGKSLTTEQAEQMLFYWKGVKAINSDYNTADEEKTGLTEQIEDVFTADQKSYIESMQLDTDTIKPLMAYLSIDQTAAASSDITISQNGSWGGPMGDQRPSGGQMPSGGGDDMRSVMMNGQENPFDTSGNQDQAQVTEMPLSDTLLQAFIEYLQGKVG